MDRPNQMDRPNPDLYELLGVRPDADTRAIKRAFQARARAMHPDVSGDPDADDRFAALSRAYAVLSRPTARLLYDRVSWPGAASASMRAPRVHLEPFEAERGANRRVMALSEAPCPECGGSGSTDAAHEAIEEEEPRPCDVCEGSGRTTVERIVDVDIPPGVENGTVIRVAAGASRGEDRERDLHVLVRVLPEPDYTLLRYAAAAALALALVLFVVLAVFPGSLVRGL
jgi:DnaJ-class molecular chaperone